jgi:4-phytase/acid phosphatase
VSVGKPDRALAVASVLGVVGGDPARVVNACRPAVRRLQQVLYGPSGLPPSGTTALIDQPSAVLPGTGDHTVDFSGPLSLALSLTDSLLLEYAEGMPMAEVGWGRLSPADLTQLLQLHAIAFNLVAGTSYPARAQGSNLADHLLRTIDQAAAGRSDPGALGPTGARVVVIVGHDTNLINLGGLLGLRWWLPGTQENPILPGGALVFELRRHRESGGYSVSTYYLSQSLEQIRSLQPATLTNPPETAPIFIPDCSTANPRFEAPLDRFDAVMRQAIDPRFVLPDPS